jgi:salicylate hydroxylase
MTRRLRIAVVGAGVAGCLVAHGLARRDDVDLVCFERVADLTHADAGTGLNIGPNAVKSLASLDAPLAAELIARSFAWQRWSVMTMDGRVLFDHALSEVADNPGLRIRWSELYRFLRGGIAPFVRYGAAVEGVRYGAQGRVVVECGSPVQAGECEFDLVIVCEGRYSKLREQLAGRPEVRHLGVANSRVLVPDESNGLVDDYEQWFNGPNRLLAFRVPGDLVYISATFPLEPGEPVPEAMKRADALRGLYTPSDGRLAPKAAYLIDALCGAQQELHWARFQEAPTLFHDVGGQVLFLGDAAHPMVPTLGQGATQAVEDAVAAVDEIRGALEGGRVDVPGVTAAVAGRRVGRVGFVAGFSREATDTMLAGSDVVGGTLGKNGVGFLGRLGKVYREGEVVRGLGGGR